MSVHIDKAWCPLTESALERVGGQLGVYELADAGGTVLYIGTASAKSLFGLRGELLERMGTAEQFRYEATSSYHTRHQELLMAHFAEHGCYPPHNLGKETQQLGRLSI